MATKPTITGSELNKLAQMVQSCIAGVQATADTCPELARALSRVAGLLWSVRDDLERLAVEPIASEAPDHSVPPARPAHRVA